MREGKMMFGMFNICLHNDDQICGKFARAFIIRENVMACTNITMKLYIAAAATLCAHSP
jgi:hypothetical protein